jgi:acyl-CoA dehydrogenase
MKSLYFNEEHELFRESVKSFVQKEIVPYGKQWEKDKRTPKSLLKKVRGLWLFRYQSQRKIWRYTS